MLYMLYAVLEEKHKCFECIIILFAIMAEKYLILIEVVAGGLIGFSI
jgi:hypothetical protein